MIPSYPYSQEDMDRIRKEREEADKKYKYLEFRRRFKHNLGEALVIGPLIIVMAICVSGIIMTFVNYAGR